MALDRSALFEVPFFYRLTVHAGCDQERSIGQEMDSRRDAGSGQFTPQGAIRKIQDTHLIVTILHGQMSKVGGNLHGADCRMTPFPKPDPGNMRESSRPVGPERIHYEEASQCR